MTCPCGRTPDPGISPGGGCNCRYLEPEPKVRATIAGKTNVTEQTFDSCVIWWNLSSGVTLASGLYLLIDYRVPLGLLMLLVAFAMRPRIRTVTDGREETA